MIFAWIPDFSSLYCLKAVKFVCAWTDFKINSPKVDFHKEYLFSWFSKGNKVSQDSIHTSLMIFAWIPDVFITLLPVWWYLHEYLMLSSLYWLNAACSCLYALKLISKMNRDQKWIFMKNNYVLDFQKEIKCLRTQFIQVWWYLHEYLMLSSLYCLFDDICMNTWCFHHFTDSKLHVLVFMRLNWFPRWTETKSGFSWRIIMFLIFKRNKVSQDSIHTSLMIFAWIPDAFITLLPQSCMFLFLMRLMKWFHDKQRPKVDFH